MKKITLTFFLAFIFAFGAFSQIEKKFYRVELKDKSQNNYSIYEPHAFLSEKAIERRTRYNIKITENDLPLTPAYVRVVSQTGVKILNKSKWFNSILIETNDQVALQKIAQLSFVKKVTPVGVQSLLKTAEDSKFKMENEETRLSSVESEEDYGNSFRQVNLHNGDILHDNGFEGTGMTIAVLDAGFYRVNELSAFEHLRNTNKIMGTWDFVTGNDSVYEDHPHGLAVLSIMAAWLPGQMRGTAINANYWLLRSENANFEYLGEEDNWAAAAEFADSVGADIISSSLGYTTFADSLEDHTYSNMDGNTTRVTIAADIAASKGILVVNSAGNSGSNPWHYIGAPADADSILAIGAVNADREYAFFSSQGPSYDGRVKPDVAAMGEGTFYINTNGGVSSGNGTSYSAPVISGLSACLWEAHRDLDNMAIIDAIKRSSSQYNTPDHLLGYGIPDFNFAHTGLSGFIPGKYNHDELVDFSPNPFLNYISINFYSHDDQELTIEMYDLIGRKVYFTEVPVVRKSYEKVILKDLDFLSQGLYIIQITSGTNHFELKAMKR